MVFHQYMGELVWVVGLTERSMLEVRLADGSKQEAGHTVDMEFEVGIPVHQSAAWSAA